MTIERSRAADENPRCPNHAAGPRTRCLTRANPPADRRQTKTRPAPRRTRSSTSCVSSRARREWRVENHVDRLVSPNGMLSASAVSPAIRAGQPARTAPTPLWLRGSRRQAPRSPVRPPVCSGRQQCHDNDQRADDRQPQCAVWCRLGCESRAGSSRGARLAPDRRVARAREAPRTSRRRMRRCRTARGRSVGPNCRNSVCVADPRMRSSRA